MPVAPRIVTDFSCVTTINHESDFAGQGQYFVRLEGDACCPGHCNGRFICEQINDESHFSWQVQYLMSLQRRFSWQAQYLVKLKCHFSWQAQDVGV